MAQTGRSAKSAGFTVLELMIALGLTTAAYFADPIKILEVWNGGLGIPGGIAGGLLGLGLYTRRAKQDLLTWTDIAAPGLALAHRGRSRVLSRRGGGKVRHPLVGRVAERGHLGGSRGLSASAAPDRRDEQTAGPGWIAPGRRARDPAIRRGRQGTRPSARRVARAPRIG